MQSDTIQLTLNGKLIQVGVNHNEILSEVLRDKLGLVATKVACNEGTCGSCTVLLNGEPVYSCLVLARDCKDKSVETLEGMSENGKHPHPLQTAFVASDSSQCGFCTPGILMTAKALLENNPNPSRDEVKNALSGNVCRCTDYSRYINAVLLAARQMREAATNV